MGTRLRCVVCATADRAIPALEALREAGHEVVRIISRPPRPLDEQVLPEEGMGSALVEWARREGIELRRPAHPGNESARSALADLRPDLGIVVAYGRRLPLPLLAVPERGWIKAHYSLLPKHRGLHPIRSALWRGSRQTGVTVIEVTEEPDGGPILGKEAVRVEPGEAFGALSERLAPLGAELLATTVDALAAGRTLKARKQNEKTATTTPRFGPRHLQAPWWREAKVVWNHLRALSPRPGMTTMIRRRKLEVVWGEPMKGANPPFGEAGTFLGSRAGRLAVLCADSTVFGIEHLRWADGTPATANEVVRELDLRVGNLLV